MPICNEKILMMLDWNNPKSIQEQGIQLALKCENFSVFVQPHFSKYNKNVWDNCAKVICKKNDLELQPFIIQLLEWVQDLNWPGAIAVLERLRFCSGEVFIKPFLQTVQKALSDKEKNEEWLYHLSIYIRRPDIFLALNDTQRSYLEKMHDCFWGDNDMV